MRCRNGNDEISQGSPSAMSNDALMSNGALLAQFTAVRATLATLKSQYREILSTYSKMIADLESMEKELDICPVSDKLPDVATERVLTKMCRVD